MDSLVALLKPQFDSKTRKRGEDYCYELDAVADVSVNDRFIQGVVYGSQQYGVELEFTATNAGLRITGMHCDCPHFADGNRCKHLWALICEVDYLSNEERGSGLNLMFAPPAAALTKSKSSKNRFQATIAKLDRGTSLALQPPHQTALFSPKNKSRLSYVIDISESAENLKLGIVAQKELVNGGWSKPRPFAFTKAEISDAPTESQPLLRTLVGYQDAEEEAYRYHSYHWEEKYRLFDVRPDWSDHMFELLAQSNRLFWAFDSALPVEDWHPIKIETQTPYQLKVAYDESRVTKTKVLLSLDNGHSQRSTGDLLALSENGICLTKNCLTRVTNPGLMPLFQLAAESEIVIKKSERGDFIELIDRLPDADQIPLPESWGISRQQVKPQVGVVFQQEPNSKFVVARVFFEYGDETFSWGATKQTIYDAKGKTILIRSLTAERQRLQQLLDLDAPLEQTAIDEDASFRLNAKHFVTVSSSLAALGWKVLWKGKPLRVATSVSAQVSSDQDWFDLDAKVNFDGTSIPLPQVLAALKTKEQYVTLHDGTLGHIPQGMLDRYAKIAQFGHVQDDSIRFNPSQAMILDAMLESQSGIEMDKRFTEYRKKLNSFHGVKPQRPSAGFKGKLRGYQSDGLGWLGFLQDFKLGGCLADDMGLGKTVQVLALLEKRRTRRIAAAKTKSSKPVAKTKKVANIELPKNELPNSELTEALGVSVEVDPWCQSVNEFKRKPTIVVVPKSLIFNWIEEAEKFAPKLRILNFTGTGRKTAATEAGEFDVLLTTYATMRIDIQKLCQINFDYAILDESQAIKNSNALVAKASRLLRSDYKLAMTGTPIENHLGELWSLFEFLNPGMLGSSRGFKAMTRIKPDDENDKRAVKALAAGLKPFFLRRTKQQVLKELPEKTEQLLTCEMTKQQQKQYDELKEYYRVKLTKKVETEGLGKSKIYVLEALLRLRQVACDPRLVDPKAKPGSKLGLLEQQLKEVIGGGSKALVFSQFTSLLALVKEQLDAAGINYEYLDGQTTKRADKVKNFQDNDDVKVFLISLKAGGSGLNLTAAQYVYLLDPWWNPAVEAQAIDRAHRMGQKNPVFAYRMTCKNTVEDKILKMQASKKLLAESVINADDSLLRNLSAEDLAMLLG